MIVNAIFYEMIICLLFQMNRSLLKHAVYFKIILAIKHTSLERSLRNS